MWANIPSVMGWRPATIEKKGGGEGWGPGIGEKGGKGEREIKGRSEDIFSSTVSPT